MIGCVEPLETLSFRQSHGPFHELGSYDQCCQFEHPTFIACPSKKESSLVPHGETYREIYALLRKPI